jgi:hypothetical protein
MGEPGRKLAAAAAAIAAMALALSACTSERMQEPPQPQQFCPQVYQPVCARTPDGQQRSYPNACTAEAAGLRAYSPGACQTAKPDRICPQISMPVCAVAAGQAATYPNDCVAGGAGARVVHPGPC